MTETRTVLVTGGCGFIGSNFIHFVHRGRPGWRIVNLDKLTYAGNLLNLAALESSPRYRFVPGDIGDKELVAEIFAGEGIDTVVHFAAESHVDRSIVGPDDFVRTNIVGTFTLLEAARQAWLSGGNPVGEPLFLHVSTDEVYGSLGPTGYFTETTPYDPRSPYSSSKAASDHLVSAYYHTYGLPTLITNCSNNYGPYQFPEKLIPLVFNNCMSGRELPVYGDGANVRDWLFVEDHCAALTMILDQAAPGQRYNIGGGSEMANIDVVALICDLIDRKAGVLPDGGSRRSLIRFVPDRPGHDRRYAIDATKLSREIGWRPSVTFAQGIELTVDWYLANQAWLDAVIDGSYRAYYEKMYG